MAEEAIGPRKESQAGWTRIFTAFRVALDIKKLLLAAGGIFATAVGWWFLAWVFYTPRAPEWKDYATSENNQEAWTRFKRDRERWNLLHEMAGPAPSRPGEARKLDAADVAGSLEEYELLSEISQSYGLFLEPIALKLDDSSFVVGGKTFVVNKNDAAALAALKGRPVLVQHLRIVDVEKQLVELAGATLKVDTDLTKLTEVLKGAKSLERIQAEFMARDANKRAAALAALDLYRKKLAVGAVLPAGKLRTLPWFEDRGPNQYLLVEGLLRKDAEGHRAVPWARGQFFNWLISDQLPVLIEPLVKFLAPIGYFFNSHAGGFRIRLYLTLVILWTVLVWAFFGGAICRIAAVQIARNEKISLQESILFAREKLLNLFTAPVFPLLFLGIMTVFLVVIAWLQGFTFFVGDIFLVAVFFPVVLLLGLIMAVVLVGLIGWPLMNPTIAAEGSDNFDALSRSYSYVYQAIWHYLWYWGVAIVYGAALIFFIGLMGSLVVYMGKWGLNMAPGLADANTSRDRDPAYLYLYAPTSYGWRDLLIKDNQHAAPVPDARGGTTYEFSEAYERSLSVPNYIAAVLVAVWLWTFFLMVVGFGYSYFWTVSTIIYFLVRKYVDDTELEEVYYEESELEPPPSVMAPVSAVGTKPGTVSLNVVEGRTPTPAAAPAPPAAAPPATAPTTQPPPPTT